MEIIKYIYHKMITDESALLIDIYLILPKGYTTYE